VSHDHSGRSKAPDAALPMRTLSLRLIVSASAVALTVGAVLSVGWVAERNARAALATEIQVRLLVQTRGLAASSASALLEDYPELALAPLARRLVAARRDLAQVVVVDHRGIVKGDADARRLQTRYVEPAGLQPIPGAGGLVEGETLRESPALLVASAPVRQPDGRVLGRAVVMLHRSYLDQALATSRRQQAFVLAGFVLLGAALAFLLMSHLLRPIAPLREGLRRIGRGDLDTPIVLHDRTEFGLLADTINDMTGTLRQAQLEMVERERLAHEVGLAKRLQLSLLPQGTAVVGGHEVQGAMEAASEVGGDYFDVVHLGDGRLGLAIADVSGKGLAGCLVMTMVSVLLRALRDTHASPTEMLVALDSRLSETLEPGMFVTMFYGVLDPECGRLVWASAGHNPTLVFRSASGLVETHTSAGIPLAAVRSGALRGTLRDATVDLAAGDALLQYTDGYTEARAGGGEEQFGIERVAATLAAHGHAGGDEVLARLRQAVLAWTRGAALDDDRTALVVHRAMARSSALAPMRRIGVAPEDQAESLLDEALKRGEALRLPARMEALTALSEWIEHIPALRAVGGAEAELLRTALHEVCANIIEHGYHGDDARSLEVWWLPALDGEGRVSTGLGLTAAEALLHLRDGLFVLRDEGAEFRGDQWTGSDFNDATVRRRGRGIGLDIIHRVMDRVEYVPGTARGNITLLGFGPWATTAGERNT
jgi:serine phosphatase RsbU (regulator of sigma subunit)/anti-sigma regulatory factor (Ser/Thr protein kinase)